MAQIEIGPLTDRLADDELADLNKALEKLGARLPELDESIASTIADDLDDDVLAEFFDRLEAEDAACEIYLPIELEARVEVGDLRVGSASHLLEVLDEIKDDLDIEEEEEEVDDDEEDEDDDDDYEEDIFEAQLKRMWKAFYVGAATAMDKRVPLYVKGE
jgi:hypothetical protein